LLVEIALAAGVDRQEGGVLLDGFRVASTHDSTRHQNLLGNTSGSKAHSCAPVFFEAWRGRPAGWLYRASQHFPCACVVEPAGPRAPWQLDLHRVIGLHADARPLARFLQQRDDDAATIEAQRLAHAEV